MSSTLAEVDIANQALDLLDEGPITALSDTSGRAKWLSRNYATTRDALLRAHPWKFSIKRRVLYPGVYPLDGIGGTLTGAWGFLRLTEGWSGNLATIRRDSDSTTDDFSYAEDELEIDTAGISDFVGSGTGYVSALFDQSGNGRTLAQASTTKQPAFDDDLGDGALPGAVFDGSNDLLATSGALSNLISTATGYVVIVGLIDTLTLDSATPTSNSLLIGDASQKIGLYARAGGGLAGYNDDGAADNTTDNVPIGATFVAELRHLSGTLYSRVNAGTERSATSGSTSSLAGALNVGDVAGSNAADFNVFAVLTFSTAPSEDDRNRLVERLMRWAFAAGRQPFSWLYQYKIPSDCLRMLPIRQDGDFEGTPLPHEIENDEIIHSNEPTQIYARFISRMTDPTRFDPQFVEALAAKLAFKMAHYITGKASYAQTVMAVYNQAIDEAKRSNAFEATPERPNDDDVINARYQSMTDIAVTFPDAL